MRIISRRERIKQFRGRLPFVLHDHWLKSITSREVEEFESVRPGVNRAQKIGSKRQCQDIISAYNNHVV
jgi:hypothetical protein